MPTNGTRKNKVAPAASHTRGESVPSLVGEPGTGVGVWVRWTRADVRVRTVIVLIPPPSMGTSAGDAKRAKVPPG